MTLVIEAVARINGHPADGWPVAAYKESAFTNKQNYLNHVLALNPVAMWRLTEASGSIYDSANGYAGSAFGGITYGVLGPPGTWDNALLFDGASGYVDFGSPSHITAMFQNHDFSVGGWVWPKQTGAGYNEFWFVCGPTAGGSTDNYLQVGQSGLSMCMKFWGDDYVDTSGVQLLPNQWNHCVVTFVASTKVGSLFLNGQLLSQNTYGGVLNVPNTAVARIARFEHGSVEYWNGELGQLALYNFALSPAQVYGNYLLGVINRLPSQLPPRAGIDGLPYGDPGTNPPDAGPVLSGVAGGFQGVGAVQLVVPDVGNYYLATYDPASLVVYDWVGTRMATPHTSIQQWTRAVFYSTSDITDGHMFPGTQCYTSTALPAATIPTDPSGPAPSSYWSGGGMIVAFTSAGIQVITFTGRTASSFTGCTGGTGTIAAGTPIFACFKNLGSRRRVDVGYDFLVQNSDGGKRVGWTSQIGGAWARDPNLQWGVVGASSSPGGTTVANLGTAGTFPINVDPGGYYGYGSPDLPNRYSCTGVTETDF